MAGAVSAGAYTAGVLDYLIETLDLWQAAKDENIKLGINHDDYDHSIPMHDVEIDIVSGTSAGGIAATLMFLSLLSDRTNPVDKKSFDSDNVKYNLQYESWVEMCRDYRYNKDPHLILKDLLSTDDLNLSLIHISEPTRPY